VRNNSSVVKRKFKNYLRIAEISKLGFDFYFFNSHV